MVGGPDTGLSLKMASLSDNPAVVSALARKLPGIGNFKDGEGETILESHEPLHLFDKAANADWMLFVQEPQADAFAASTHMKNITTLLILGTVILGMGAGILLTRSILIPLYQLVSGTREIATGNLAYRVESQSRDEIGALSAAFNKMGSSLEKREHEIAGISAMAKSLGGVMDLDSLLDRGIDAITKIVESYRVAFMLGSPPVIRKSRNWPTGELPLLPGTGTINNKVEPAWNGVNRLLSVPLVHEDRPLGYLVILEKPDNTPFVQNDKRDAEIIASAVSAAVVNIQLLDEMVEKTRMESELKTAEVVQKTLFPRKDFRAAGLHLSGNIRPASETGGDWYGYLKDPETGRVAVLIGDVTGHGVSAALITASTHSFIRSLESFSEVLRSLKQPPPSAEGASGGSTEARDFAEESRFDPYRPDNLLTLLNKVIYATGEGQMNMTFFVTLFDLDKGVMEFANAGHPLPYVLEGGERLTVLKAVGPRLGESLENRWTSKKRDLVPGDVFTWVTDGIAEGIGKNGKMYGERRLRKIIPTLSGLDAQKIKMEILRDLDQHLDTTPLDDDVTLVVGKIPSRERDTTIIRSTRRILLAAPSLAEAGIPTGVFEDGSLSCTPAATEKELFSFLDHQPFSLLMIPVTKEHTGLKQAMATLKEARNRQGDIQGAFLMTGAGTEELVGDIVGTDPPNLLINTDEMAGDRMLHILEYAVKGAMIPFSSLMPGDTPITPLQLNQSGQRETVIGAVGKYLQRMGASMSVQKSAWTSLSELLMNAFYAGPRDDTGAMIHLEARRNKEIEIPEGKVVEVKVGITSTQTFISVTDPFGVLTPQEIYQSLRRGQQAATKGIGFDSDTQGAGIGLSMVFRHSKFLMFNITRGRSTEVICEFSSKGSRSSIRRPGKSLAIFEGTHEE